MSGNSTLSPSDQDLIAGLPALFAENYSAISAAVLLLYDYFLTFPLELQYIWQGEINIMKILFIPTINLECRAFYYTSEVSGLFGPLAITSIFTLRAYAIYGRSRTVLFLLAVPGFVYVASSTWFVFTQSPVLIALPLELQIGAWGCFVNSSSSNTAAELLSDASSAAFDALTVILTVCCTGRIAMQSREANIRKSLSFVLLRDGVLYYSAIFIPEFVLVALDAVLLRSESDNLSNVCDALYGIVNVLQTVLVNRLVLNLSHAADPCEDSEFRTRTGLEPPTFAAGPFLGNIGGPLRTLPDDLDDEVLEGNENRETCFVRDKASTGVPISAHMGLGSGLVIEEIHV